MNPDRDTLYCHHLAWQKRNTEKGKQHIDQDWIDVCRGLQRYQYISTNAPPSLYVIASIESQAGTKNIECVLDYTGAPAACWVVALVTIYITVGWGDVFNLMAFWPTACMQCLRLVVINVSCRHVPHVWQQNLRSGYLLLSILDIGSVGLGKNTSLTFCLLCSKITKTERETWKKTDTNRRDIETDRERDTEWRGGGRLTSHPAFAVA